MYIAQVTIASKKRPTKALAASSAIHRFLSTLMKNGQVCGRKWPVFEDSAGYVTHAFIPDKNSLSEVYWNVWVRDSLNNFQEAGLGEPTFMVARDIEGGRTCKCSQHSAYILYTIDQHIDPPLRCGDCFLPVPLYRIPPTYDDTEYYDITTWQSSYESCDKLYFISGALEHSAVRQLSRADSALSLQGQTICTRIYTLTTVPTYYYLFRYNGRSRKQGLSLKQEEERLCPCCGGEWLLQQPWHVFDFKCDKCHLVSNIAFSVLDTGRDYPIGRR